MATRKDINSNDIYMQVDHHTVTISYIGNLMFSGKCECGIVKEESSTHVGIRQYIHKEHLKITAE